MYNRSDLINKGGLNLDSIHSFKHKLRIAKSILRREKNSNNRLNPLLRLRYNLNGFLSDAHIYYHKPLERKNLYINDFQQSNAWNINEKKYREILNNKIKFDEHFNQHISTPKTLGTISNGKIDNDYPYVIQDFYDLKIYLENQGPVVLKAISGAGGFGILILKLKDKQLFLNNKLTNFNEFKSILTQLDNYYISEFLNQSTYKNSLFPHTVNTIRMLTMVDPETKKPFIAVAVQRVGTKESIPTDNWQQGAMSVKIDLESGTLGQVVRFTKDGKIERRSTHPDTGKKLTGKRIPNWEEVKKQILKAASNNSFLSYIGWDVVITENGVKVLEANNGSGVIIYQVHDPLLKNEKIRRFYKHYNII